MKKILVLCDAGQVRSVAMASVLRERGHFAVAGSYDNFKKLYDEHVSAVLNNEYGDVPNFQNFLLFFDESVYMQEGGEHFIGRDIWGDCMHPELIEKCKAKATELGL